MTILDRFGRYLLSVGPKRALRAVAIGCFAAAGTVAVVGNAASGADTCAPRGDARVVVDIDSPDAGDQVDGPVAIAGTARVAVLAPGRIDTVEIRAGDEVVATVPAGRERSASFRATWDSSAAVGEVTITATACGDGGEVWGRDRVTVVAGGAPGEGPGSTTTVPGGAPADTVPSTVPADSSTTTTVAGSSTTTSSSSTTSSTTSTTAPSTTTTTARAELSISPDDAGFQALGGGRVRDAFSEDGDGGGPPLYPAASAGLAAVGGLVWALAPRAERRKAEPDPALLP